MRSLRLAAIVAAILTSSAARAVVIDFSAVPAGELPSYTEAGVTFTAVPPGTAVTASGFGDTPNGTPGLVGVVTGGIFPELRADLPGLFGFVSVDLGDFNADADTLFLEVYSAGDVLLGSTTLLIDDAFVGMMTLSQSVPGIAYAIYGARTPALGGSSVYSDNFTFEDGVVQAVPEPSTLALLAFGGVACLRRRRRSA